MSNKRARFYFTERGWHEVGQYVYPEAKRRGFVVSVIRRREPADSPVVFRDEWQVAILPDKRRRHKRRRPSGSDRADPDAAADSGA